MKCFFQRFVCKGDEVTPLELEHILLAIFGLCCVAFGGKYYEFGSVPQVIALIIYLTLLVGIAPLPMPTCKSNFSQVVVAGLLSGLLDSFIVLLQCVGLRTKEGGNWPRSGLGETDGERAKLLALITISALVGGLIIWFGEVYAAPLYNNDSRTGVLSALYIVPPVMVFLCCLGWHAKGLNISVVPSKKDENGKRNLVEFLVGIAGLLCTHNPVLCGGWLLMYVVLTRQDGHLINAFKHHMEVNVLLVMMIAWIAGPWIMVNLIETTGIGTGTWKPIFPAAFQAVLWGPLYADPTQSFWIKITTLSTGALIFPVSSLVGVLLFRNFQQWLIYMKYSIPYALLWYVIMRVWIWLTLDTPIGAFLEHWAHSGTPH